MKSRTVRVFEKDYILLEELRLNLVKESNKIISRTPLLSLLINSKIEELKNKAEGDGSTRDF